MAHFYNISRTSILTPPALHKGVCLFSGVCLLLHTRECVPTTASRGVPTTEVWWKGAPSPPPPPLASSGDHPTRMQSMAVKRLNFR